ncbi:PD-(D/E)XK nuclease family protein [Dokdonia ponticola]|uniref:PD-(D/E)XK nuclease family protein n=1 Tax=Dokdonia ponticola TaxID=2041041 RepID=A0ABV9I4J2_9FLAO
MNNINVEHTEHLLKDVKDIIVNHEALARERGEDFNLFSIMNMESNETYTHSAVLVALLDPKGNHYKDELFLKLFLDEISYEYSDEDLQKVKVVAEYHTGKIDEEYTKGGFIDILLTFNSGKTLAIENKIYAKDQRRQLFRYSKYNKERSRIYYLNLFGTSPEEQSYHPLELGKDFEIISYKTHITNWLENCLENSQNEFLVQSSLKQYLILIQKMTDTMDKTREDELKKVILHNIDAAKHIAHNYNDIIYNIREGFRLAISNKLKSSVSSEYVVTEGYSASYHFSQIFIKLVDDKNAKIEFGIESFSGKGNDGGKLYIGILDRLHIPLEIEYINQNEDKRLSQWWPVRRVLKTRDGNSFHLNSENLLKKLGDADTTFFTDAVQYVTEQAVTFIKEYTPTLKEIHKASLIEKPNLETDFQN